jgi:rhodanese-related sulfurtransferase
VLNSKEHQTLESSLQRVMTPLSLEQVLDLQKSGAVVLDVRDPADFARGHLAGSINIGLGGQYATWAGTVLDRERQLVIIAPPGREEEAATRLGRIGFDQAAGYLASGMEALDERPDLLAGTDRISANELADELASTRPPLVLDVRRPKEWAGGHIDGSVNVPLNHLLERVGELPRDRRIVVHCATAYRSSIAASLLAREGFDRLGELTGGIAAWAQRNTQSRVVIDDQEVDNDGAIRQNARVCRAYVPRRTGARASLVCGTVRCDETPHAAGCRHQDRVDQSARPFLCGCDRRNREGDELESRTG